MLPLACYPPCHKIKLNGLPVPISGRKNMTHKNMKHKIFATLLKQLSCYPTPPRAPRGIRKRQRRNRIDLKSNSITVGIERRNAKKEGKQQQGQQLQCRAAVSASKTRRDKNTQENKRKTVRVLMQKKHRAKKTQEMQK